MITLFNRKGIQKLFISALLGILTIPMQVYANSNDLSLLLSLKGSWSFSIGFNDEWTSPKFDDSDWETIKAPSAWEDQGFNGYDGYAFYRKKISIPSVHKGSMLYLHIGYIDDVDEVYLNGKMIGSTGDFPPNYVTAYNAERIYYIPEKYINFDGSNLIAVKVYDSYGAGGIVSGAIGLYGDKNPVKLDANLQTLWKFKPGDDLKRKEVDFDDSDWDEIFVPSSWEDQGYRDYDGFAWYRKSFVYQGNDADDKLVILLGKIDDIDQLYVNGTLVASTGNFPLNRNTGVHAGPEYEAFRGYYIPEGLLKKGKLNVIAVRVLDTGGVGGIYKGPVGIVTQTKYIEYWRNRKKAGN
ncbi:MAG: beta galactosidase jelly roll domain-containing protein [Bacteroidales bacterium]|nr:beta galactosidase jelly roll domain-containing protein [Bacteroidales bacterium]